MNYLEDFDSELESAEDYMSDTDEDEFGEEDDEEINEMLEALMDEADEDEDLAERRRRRSRRARGRGRRRWRLFHTGRGSRSRPGRSPRSP